MGFEEATVKKHQCTVICVLSGRGFKLSIFNTKSLSKKCENKQRICLVKKDLFFLIDWLELSHSCTIVICKVC
jgi:hypothetical protein